MPQFRDLFKAGIILAGACFVMWVLFIRPHSYEWQDAGQTRGQVKSLMSNSKVYGKPVINAVVTLETGRQTLVAIPLKSDILTGDDILLQVYEDAERPNRKRYAFYKELS